MNKQVQAGQRGTFYRLVQGADQSHPHRGAWAGSSSSLWCRLLVPEERTLTPCKKCYQGVEMMEKGTVILRRMGRTLSREQEISHVSLLSVFYPGTVQWKHTSYILYMGPSLTLDPCLCCRFFAGFTHEWRVSTLSKGKLVTQWLPFVYNHFAFIYGLAPAAPGRGTKL